MILEKDGYEEKLRREEKGDEVGKKVEIICCRMWGIFLGVFIFYLRYLFLY